MQTQWRYFLTAVMFFTRVPVHFEQFVAVSYTHLDVYKRQHLIGKNVKLPLCDREIPIIADDYVDKAFGTGVVKMCIRDRVGTMQAAEALKILMGIGESLQGRLLLLDALSMEWRTIKLKKDPACIVCG